MIDINELRQSLGAIRPEEVAELLDRLEAAEKERDDAKAAAKNIALKLDYLRSKLETAENAQNDWLRANAPGGWIDNLRIENEALRAKVARMEKQKPVGEIRRANSTGNYNNSVVWVPMVVGSKLYALPGAQPAPSVPDGWLRAIDEALVVANIGVANESDTYEQAKAKLDSLIGFHVDVATDPAVNGGWKLVPIEPTDEMLRAIRAQRSGARKGSGDRADWKAWLTAAPETKP